MHNPFWIRSYIARRYDEAVAKAAYIQHMAEVAAKQDLTEDVRDRSRWLTIGFTLFATVVVAMRFVARRRQGAKLLIDDWLTVVTLVILYGNMIMNIVCKLSLHLPVRTRSDLRRWEKRRRGQGESRQLAQETHRTSSHVFLGISADLLVLVINQGVGLHTGALSEEQLETMNQVSDIL